MSSLSHTQHSKLSSLADWSVSHIQRVFEAPTDSEALLAVSETFSPSLDASLNGRSVPREGIEKLVLGLRHSSPGGNGLKVEWKHTLEVPEDESNRGGSFGGFYIIHGLRKTMPGSEEPVQFARHKTVTVKIESENNDDPEIDSRRIVNLIFVASDFREKL